jgi:hypothetical protein
MIGRLVVCTYSSCFGDVDANDPVLRKPKSPLPCDSSAPFTKED